MKSWWSDEEIEAIIQDGWVSSSTSFRWVEFCWKKKKLQFLHDHINQPQSFKGNLIRICYYINEIDHFIVISFLSSSHFFFSCSLEEILQNLAADDDGEGEKLIR